MVNFLLRKVCHGNLNEAASLAEIDVTTSINEIDVTISINEIDVTTSINEIDVTTSINEISSFRFPHGKFSVRRNWP